MKSRKIPFGVQITAILIAGVLLSCISWFAVQHIRDKLHTAKPQKHTVTFAYLDGTVIQKKSVSHGKGVFPPELSLKGVFRGWSTGFNMVVGDLETHPIYYEIEEQNLFYFHAVYVEEGKQFSMDVHLGGRVAISSGTLTIEYDEQVLEYLESKNPACCTVKHNKTGELEIHFESDMPIREDILLSQLVFKAKEMNAYSTEIVLKAKDTQIVTVDGQKNADCATINNKVYFLQEVEE